MLDMSADNLFFNRYQVIGNLHVSPSSKVFCAKDQYSGEMVLLKCFTAKHQHAYLREMSAAFGLNHPNINLCLDTFYHADGSPCMVYEYIAGGNLRAYLEAHSKLPQAWVLQCLQNLLKALHYLHEHDMIHCDIKPENVLLRYTSENPLPTFILADLGAAAPLREALESHHDIGSPAYLAPERLYEKFSFTSDLYSLGVLGFEIITGQRPFEGDGGELARAHLGKAPPLELIEQEDLRDFIERLLEKDPRQRLDSITALHILEYLGDDDAPPLVATKATNARTAGMFFPAPVINAMPLVGELESWQKITQITLHFRPEKLWTFHLHGEPLVALRHAGHVEFIGMQGAVAAPPLVGASAFNVLGSDQLAYATQSRVYSVNLADKTRDVLLDPCPGITNFALCETYLLWCAPSALHLRRLNSDEEYVMRIQQYVMTPTLLLLQNGHFYLSEGYMNHEAVLRDHQCTEIRRFILDGPILAYCAQYSAVFALSMDFNRETHYSLWRLPMDGRPAEHLPLSADLSAWSNTDGRFWWVSAKGLIRSHRVPLNTYTLGSLAEGIDMLHFSSDYRFLATAVLEESAAHVSLWQNPV